MKKRNIKKSWYQNGYFLSGLGLSTLLFVIMGSILYANGLLKLKIKNISPEESYANSLSPRKNAPTSWYTMPSPDPSHPDQTAPVVTITSPANGSNVDPESKVKTYYIVPVEVTVNEPVSRMYQFVNDVLDGINAYTSTKYMVTSRIPNQPGTYVIKMTVYDYNFNPGTATVSVVVPKSSK
jgi:hypothetical protein